MIKTIYVDQNIAIIDKDPGVFVHRPQFRGQFRGRNIPKSENALALLRDHLGKKVFPVHRLDRATSGLLVFALSSESASTYSTLFQDRKVEKTYYTVVRGYTEDKGVIDSPLKRDSSNTLAESFTSYETLRRIELPKPVGRYPTARYSLLRVSPKTGRFHQIRRHLARISHPIIGDSIHGDTKHNRFFREDLKIPGLLLRAHCISFSDPLSGEFRRFVGHWPTPWALIFQLFNDSVL